MAEYDAVELNSVMTNLCLITWIRITEGEWRQEMALKNFFSSLISLMTRLQRYSSFRIINEQYGDWGKKSEWERDAYLKIGFRAWYVKNAKGHITYTELNFSSIRGSLLSKTDKSWRVPTLAFAHYIGFSTHKYECTHFPSCIQGEGAYTTIVLYESSKKLFTKQYNNLFAI